MVDLEESLKYANLSLQENSLNSGTWRLKALIYGAQNQEPMASLSLAEYHFSLQEYQKNMRTAEQSRIYSIE